MTTERNAAIDALKGIMIIVIILHHSRFIPFLHHGYLAVDVFFWVAGLFLMQSFSKYRGSAVLYTGRRIKKVILPYLIAFALACILDIKHLLSFRSFDEFMEIFTPFSAFLTFTEELGPLYHSYVVLVGGWFLSVLIISGFLLYALLEYNDKLATKVLLPFGMVLGFTFLFHDSPSIERFSVAGAIGYPLLRGFVEMGAGALLFSILSECPAAIQRHNVLINVTATAAFAFFIGLFFTNKALDAYSIVLIPLILAGLLSPESWACKVYQRVPVRLLPTFGKLSLEIYLIHSPIIHLVHSAFKLLHLPLVPWALVIADLIAVILAATLLNRLLNAPRLAHHRT